MAGKTKGKRIYIIKAENKTDRIGFGTFGKNFKFFGIKKSIVI